MYKVLIVDDEKPVRIAISKLGKWSKWHIEEPLFAENGKEALRLLTETHPSIVFVDMQMPVMSGTEFLRQARKLVPDSPDSKTVFVVISGYDEFQYARDALHYGAMDYLLKPVVADELNAVIGRAMKKLYPDAYYGQDNQEGKQTLGASEVTQLIHETIETHYSDNIRIQDFADKYYFSREYLSRLFKTEYGTGIYEYLTQVRMSRAEELLADPSVSIAEIASRIGFSDSNYFSKAFRTWSGMSPSDWRKAHI